MAEAARKIDRSHNQGPVTLDTFDERVRIAFEAVEKRINELEVGLQRVPEVIDRDNEGRVSDFLKQVKEAQKDAEKTRKTLKGPLDAKGTKIQNYHRSLIAPLEKVLKAVNDRFDEYDRKRRAEEQARIEEERRKAREAEERAAREAEEARKQAEEAARAADDEETRARAEQAMAAARQAEREAVAANARTTTSLRASVGTIRGEASQRVSQSFWDFEADHAAIDLNRLRDYLGRDAIETAIRKAIRDHTDGDTCRLTIPGVRIFRNERRITR